MIDSLKALYREPTNEVFALLEWNRKVWMNDEFLQALNTLSKAAVHVFDECLFRVEKDASAFAIAANFSHF